MLYGLFMTDPYVLSLFEYNEDAPSGVTRDGRPTGHKFHNGYGRHYWRVCLQKNRMSHQVLTHILVWELVNGQIPDGMTIDHKDNNPLNNRIENLRLATKAEQAYNRSRNKTNLTGFKGVAKKAGESKFSARIRADGKNHHIGMFDTAEQAHQAYCEASLKLHGLFHNPG